MSGEERTQISFVWAWPELGTKAVERLKVLAEELEYLRRVSDDGEWHHVEAFLAKAGTARYRLLNEPKICFQGQWCPIELYVAFYEKSKTITIVAATCLPHGGDRTDEVVDFVTASLQSFTGRGHCSAASPLQVKTSDGTDVNSIHEAVVRSISTFDPRIADRALDAGHSWCVELRRETDEDAGRLERNWPQEYAMTVGDEGWRFIDADCARQRLGEPWTTRTIVDVRSVGRGVLVVNTKGPDYIAKQGEFCRNFFGAEEPYFAINSRIAGLDHGVLHALERVTIRRVFATAWLEDVHQARSEGDVRHRRLVRSTLDQVSELLNPQLMPEVDSMERMFLERMGLAGLVAQLDRVANSVDEQTRFDYETSVNRKIALLTWLIVLLTLATVVLGIVTLLKG
jgi:hypothetical protein